MLTIQRLRELLDYDPLTGIFYWRHTLRNGRGGAGVVAGHRATRLRQEYITIAIDRHIHRAHRLAWLFVYERWPTNEIDHINGQKDDNRITNLREAEHHQNCGNRKPNTGTAIKGVIYDRERSKWRAAIRGKIIGRFDTPEEAGAAYSAAAQKIYGEFARSA